LLSQDTSPKATANERRPVHCTELHPVKVFLIKKDDLSIKPKDD
jgi:hypothetical protein